MAVPNAMQTVSSSSLQSTSELVKVQPHEDARNWGDSSRVAVGSARDMTMRKCAGGSRASAVFFLWLKWRAHRTEGHMRMGEQCCLKVQAGFLPETLA